MQDLQCFGAGAEGDGGRFFAAGAADRRLRLHGHLAQQPLKCPRCDSLNTKFCYYNNYNLSQPRHFCKACRRYWTKGGVLRSVPVGGGCRKTKRSKSRSGGGEGSGERKSKAQSPSSTDSSSLTTATTSSAAALDSGTNFNFSSAVVYNANPPVDPSFDDHSQAPPMNHSGSADCRIFSEIESLDGIVASSDNAAGMIGLSMADIPTASYEGIPRAPADDFKMQDEMTAAMDWGSCGGGDQSLFDLTAALDPSYWSQPQWTDSNHSLSYLP